MINTTLQKTIKIKTKKYKKIENALRMLEKLATDYFESLCFIETYTHVSYLVYKENFIPIQIKKHFCGTCKSAQIKFNIYY